MNTRTDLIKHPRKEGDVQMKFPPEVKTLTSPEMDNTKVGATGLDDERVEQIISDLSYALCIDDFVNYAPTKEKIKQTLTTILSPVRAELTNNERAFNEGALIACQQQKQISDLSDELSTTKAELERVKVNIKLIISELEGMMRGIELHPSDIPLNGCLISKASKEKLNNIYDIIARYKALNP